MGIFSRKKTISNDTAENVGEPDDGLKEEAEPKKVEASVGPCDIGVEELGDSYADFGAIKIKPLEGMQVNLPPNTPPYEYITFVIGSSAVQISVFAIPKNLDGWKKRKEQIIAAYEEQGLAVRSGNSRYGEDVLVDMPVETPDGRSGIGTIRFAGVSGERWVAQIGFHGQAVDPDSSAAHQIDEFLDEVRVERGNNPHPPFTPLEITLPLENLGA
ncbi:DUF3710 domain-containing protein [Actinomycetaceae bacterium TAE3-ERU4]|nr:DUF3710 domain-containing protein [Actinomycetaceae bacterium TAE3-ERU4]